MPKEKGRAQALERVLQNDCTTIVYESPHQLHKTLAALAAHAPDRRIAVCKELTKLHERVFRGTLAQAAEAFSGENRGEYVLVLEGRPHANHAQATDEQLVSELAALLRAGYSRKDAATHVSAKMGVSKNHAYKLSLALENREK